MIPRLAIPGSSLLLLVTAHAFVFAAPHMTVGNNGPTEISGDYRYAYHEPETAAEARETACTEALFQALSRHPTVREQTAPIVDSRLIRSVIQTLAKQHVHDQRIVQQSEQGRTIYCKVSGRFDVDDVQRVLLAHTTGSGEQALDQNRALRIISAREAPDGTVVVVYQALKRLDWLGTAYQGSLREAADVMVDFYDEQGTLLRSTRHPARKTPGGEDIMNPGEIATLKIAKPLNAKTYRVWLVK
ncbi:MAG: hypothetical protein NBKEAIPA_03639 [Nitrospirae bacterium]|nr:hypothetical protein [Nitrospirota bacterium]MEB2340265.1 hypothetical protein [Nitrospirales bacterium]QOJ34431.1 MAG: hypothetical protein HRU82_05475 [Nitrospira sp.]